MEQENNFEIRAELKNTLQQADILKARLQAIRPPDVEALQKIKAAFEMEYTYESNRIEGNTLTLQETALEQSHTDNNHEPFYLLVANAVKQSLEMYLGIIVE
jgi:Fic family protein